MLCALHVIFCSTWSKQHATHIQATRSLNSFLFSVLWLFIFSLSLFLFYFWLVHFIKSLFIAHFVCTLVIFIKSIQSVFSHDINEKTKKFIIIIPTTHHKSRECCRCCRCRYGVDFPFLLCFVIDNGHKRRKKREYSTSLLLVKFS